MLLVQSGQSLFWMSYVKLSGSIDIGLENLWYCLNYKELEVYTCVLNSCN